MGEVSPAFRSLLPCCLCACATLWSFERSAFRPQEFGVISGRRVRRMHAVQHGEDVSTEPWIFLRLQGNTPGLSDDKCTRTMVRRCSRVYRRHTWSCGKGGKDMNRMRLVALCVAVSMGCFGMAFGIDLVDPSKAPATYVKVVKQGDQTVPVFDDTTHWFSAKTFNNVLA